MLGVASVCNLHSVELLREAMASGSGLKVFFDLFSQPSRAVLLLLNVNKVPYEPMMLKLSQGI